MYKFHLNIEDLKQGISIVNIFHKGDFAKAVCYTKD